MAKRPLPNNQKARNMVVNQFTVTKAVQFPELQTAVAAATGGSKNGNGNGKDKALTKEDFDSGFSGGVGQIKEGLSGLGAGLGPLTVLVDFVKGFASKIGNLFTIFKGFFNILMSIPRAIANAFKKKDKEEDKKDKKEGKIKNALEKGKKKERDKDRKEAKKGRGGFMRFATMLKPVLLIGAVLAISAGLLMLYNWLVGKGLFKLLDDLATNFRVGLIDLQLGIAKIFGKEQKLEMLREEKAALIIEKKVVPNLTEADKQALATIPSKAGQAAYIANLATTKGYGIEKSDAQKDMARDSGSMRERVDKTVLGKNEQGQNITLNLGSVAATDSASYSLDTKKTIKNLNMSELTSDMGLGSTLRTSSQFTETRQVGLGILFDDNVYGVRTIDKADGTPLTVDDLTDQLIAKNDPNAFATREEARVLAMEIVAEAPGIAFGPEGTIISTEGYVDNSIMPGAIKLKEGDDGGYVEDRGMQAAIEGYGFELDENNRLVEAEKLPFFDALGFGQVVRYFNAFSDESIEESERKLDAGASDLINEAKLDQEIMIGEDELLELRLEDILSKDGEMTEKDRELLNDLESYQRKGGDASEYGIYFDQAPDRKDRSFYYKDYIDKERMAGQFNWALKSDEDIRAMLVEDLMEMTDLGKEAATQVVNTYVDSSSNVQQTVVPQNDTGSSTSSNNGIVIPNIPGLSGL